MAFTEIELTYLASQPVGRLATVQPDGTVQVNPVGFRYNPQLGTIDIGGFNFATSRKFRNIADNGRAALVVDDVVSTDPWRIRCVEIRGEAKTVVAPEVFPDLDDEVIRIHPRRVISFGVGEPDVPPHELKYNSRNVGTDR
ncbi:PPOX class F420-dependent oxidoreductase [Actinokineospora sp. PR83]|uniref:PPOX class F420-dependent oxidoreductase n=1 Tax=Actinokineospora sp. PR83 TaxID=2884908 RepID=UPI001F253469|nr:PPOX class F420-dependent oxidoreductase [Actinokineospora sp. PR83]MCG8916950.1 PPOX class F420-dependent oxidoreductase [Actinokineospora sp. PR83]